MNPERARYAAPAAFLVAVTIAALIIHSSLKSSPSSTSTGTTQTQTQTQTQTTFTTETKTTSTTGTTATSTTAGSDVYVIQAGDTLGTIAASEGTTVDDLLALNPGIDPTSLQVGQRIRVH